MNILRAEKITGLRIEPTPSPMSSFRALDGDREVARAYGRDNSQALSDLITKVYQATSAMVRVQQGYRCLICAGLKPLECHHLHPRGRGRDDSRENLAALCGECHSLVTDGKIKSILPSQTVLDSLKRHGYEWGDGRWTTITV